MPISFRPSRKITMTFSEGKWPIYALSTQSTRAPEVVKAMLARISLASIVVRMCDGRRGIHLHY